MYTALYTHIYPYFALYYTLHLLYPTPYCTPRFHVVLSVQPVPTGPVIRVLRADIVLLIGRT